MKRARLQQWSGQLLSSKGRPCRRYQQVCRAIGASDQKSFSTTTPNEYIEEETSNLRPRQSLTKTPRNATPTPKSSAKLAALHARLSLPTKVPLSTLARVLIDSTAERAPDRNNASFAQVGQALLSYHVTEWLVTTYPRLPMAVLFAAVAAYIGPATLSKIAQEWGVETAAFPGPEVDPGLLQVNRLAPGAKIQQGTSIRPDKSPSFRRGISSRVVYDDEFGDLVRKDTDNVPQISFENAHMGFVRALVGSIYVHAGSAEAKAFINAHILSRHLPIDRLFAIKVPTRDLSRLCAREGFDRPVARLLSETGRLSISPVFVVGIFSGDDKLGEGSGPSLDEARMRAATSALKAWYLYSPTSGKTGRVPSDVELGGDWTPVYIDIGEIVD